MTIESKSPELYRFYIIPDSGKVAVTMIVGFVACALSIGVYFPWYQANVRRSLIENLYFQNSPLQYHGTGFDLAIEWAKAILLAFVFLNAGMAANHLVPFGQELSVLAFGAVLPIVFFKHLQMYAADITWQDSPVKLSGSSISFCQLQYKNIFLTLVTFGYYLPWAIENTYSYVVNHVTIGRLQLRMRPTISEYRFIWLVCWSLAIPSFGLSLGLFALFQIKQNVLNNTFIGNDKGFAKANYASSLLESSARFVFSTLSIFMTGGLATPWVVVANIQNFAMKFKFIGHIDLPYDKGSNEQNDFPRTEETEELLYVAS